MTSRENDLYRKMTEHMAAHQCLTHVAVTQSRTTEKVM